MNIMYELGFLINGYLLLQVIDRSSLRSHLRSQTSTVKSLDAETKFQALSYILADANYSDLNEIHLLPLDDGTFTSFTSSPSSFFFGAITILMNLNRTT
jgi:hypothetical protein